MMTETAWPRGKADPEKLRAFGFTPCDEGLVYRREILPGMTMSVLARPDGRVFAEVTDSDTGEEYLLYRVESATGAFVGQVREAFAALLAEIADACCEADAFQSGQTRRVLAYIKETYGEEPEFLWENYPDCAVVRRADNRKWYAVILTVERRVLGLSGAGKTEVLNVRMPPEQVPEIVDRARYFPAYHMNKKHWISLCPDAGVPDKETFSRVDESRRLASRK